MLIPIIGIPVCKRSFAACKIGNIEYLLYLKKQTKQEHIEKVWELVESTVETAFQTLH